MDLMHRAGPEALTFAAVGKAVGLSPATLVQRYHSKEAFLRATLMRAWDGLDALTAAADLEEPVTAEGAIAMLVRMFPTGTGETDYAEGLLILREDMRDPILRARGTAWGEVLALALGRRLTQDWVDQMRLGRLMANGRYANLVGVFAARRSGGGKRGSNVLVLFAFGIAWA